MTAPHHAISVWLEGDEFALQIDDQTARLPTTASGVHVLMDILRHRQGVRRPTIGTEAKPTQWDLLRQVAKYNGPVTLPESETKRREAKAFLEDLMGDDNA